MAVTTQADIWNDVVGEAWVTHAEIHDAQAAPFGHAVMHALGDLTGARVVDVGCGTGGASAELLERGAVEVTGLDLSVPMIDAARATAGAGARFEVADASSWSTPDEVDVVFSRFGVMFFDDPVAAFAHLGTLTGPGGRLGFCCWGPPTENPVMTLPLMASVPVLGPPALAGPGEPGPFSLSAATTVTDVLTQAGWRDVEIEALAVDPPHPAGSAEAVADVVLDFNPFLVLGLRRAPDQRAATRVAIVDALRATERDGVVHLRASALIVTARR